MAKILTVDHRAHVDGTRERQLMAEIEALRREMRRLAAVLALQTAELEYARDQWRQS